MMIHGVDIMTFEEFLDPQFIDNDDNEIKGAIMEEPC